MSKADPFAPPADRTPRNRQAADETEAETPDDGVVTADDADEAASTPENAESAPEAAEEASDETDGAPAGMRYEELTVEVLRAELKARELPTSGNKAELVGRLQESDETDADPEVVESE